MIYFETNVKDLEYPIFCTLKSFYPFEEIKVSTGNSEETEYLHFKITVSIDLINVKFTDGKQIDEFTVPYLRDAVLQKEVQRALYKFLSKTLGKKLPWGILTGIRPAKLVHEMLQYGTNEFRIKERLTNYFYIDPKKCNLLYTTAVNELKILKETKENTAALYIGIPFCPSTCLYCSFTSYPAGRYESQMTEYIESLIKEIAFTLNFIEEKGLKLESLYIGGGTPTALNFQCLHKLLSFISENIDVCGLREYTIEAGRPDSINTEKLELLKKNHAGRISINPQTANDKTLRAIGRNHNWEQLLKAFEYARKTGFNNINMDIIAGLPGENQAMFENTLQKVCELEPESITLHTMSVKRASRLNQNLFEYELPDEKTVINMVESAHDYLGKMEYLPYYLYRQKNILANLENVGYCKKGFESIYNIQIMEERQCIAACGAGASTKVVFPGNRIERVFNVKNVEAYIKRLDEMIQRKKNLFSQL